MILSQQFSRQNRGYQSLSNGTNSGAPSSPTTQNGSHFGNGQQRLSYSIPKQQSKAAANGFKSSTLNRLDQLRRRQQVQQNNWNNLETKRSMSLLRDSTSVQDQANVVSQNGYKTHDYKINNPSSTEPNAIYAPVSIASPHEYYGRRSNQHNFGHDSQHYASTSCGQYFPPQTSRGTPIDASASSESGRSASRRESALGHLWQRIGTLQRRIKRPKPQRSQSVIGAPILSSQNGYRHSNGFVYGTPNNIQLANGGLSHVPEPKSLIKPEQQVPVIDPEIYAKGKKEVGAEEIYAEGQQAIDGNISRRLIEHNINEATMSEGEVITLVDESSRRQQDYLQLVAILTNWINDELAQQRIVVKDLQEDLYDGQILGKLFEKLQQVKLDIVEVTQNETNQRLKLRTVLDLINRTLSLQARWARVRWSVDGILSKNIIEIIHLLMTLALYHRVPIKVPPNVTVNTIIIQKNQGRLMERSQPVKLTEATSNLSDGPNGQFAQQRPRDAFDTLIEFAPDKLAMVKQTLVKFVNRHLNKINMSCFTDRVNELLDPEQFSDGLLLVFLIASLEDYFVPLGNLFTAPIESNHSKDTLTLNGLKTALEPESYINSQPLHKLHNVNVALQLIEDSGIEIKKFVRAEDIVNGDLKSLLRVLYTLFSRYKHL